ncbi:MAG: hypothetical protein EA415_12270 [Sphaerobacteraceae bacterium]|nr:MAG: hypothetical protein EA415_12270 [Sphaerobacteraceae bacterium]
MAGYSVPTRETDPVHTVRTVGRLAQMVLELRDEYVRDPRPDTLDQIIRRLDEINRLSLELKRRQELDAEGADESETSDDEN